MFGKMGDMMGQLKDAQQKMEETKERLKSITMVEESNNGKIKVTISAAREIKDIHIDESLLQDTEELSDNLVLTLNKAIEKANNVNESEMQGAAAGMMNMPGMGNLFGK
ncbi:YbaB/EbfC family nucleoid-associated protein [Owenweeksia hongkongensis]|uniref:YbaB/EbfC family nucleoid-associated protein n=1 Tax=Owenweeksia hongkongensis TaxID=253245 RepID=UPI003A90DB34